ncbi:MAG: formate--tetrahydrofolate ligase, partial [Candidatus Thermoplasmatota archaeon]
EKGKGSFRYLYNINSRIKEKIETIATIMYGARRVVYTIEAEKQIEEIEKIGLGKLLVCIAKTPYSLSDNPKLLGRPRDFELKIREIRVFAGAGYIVPMSGALTTMPGLPKHSSAEDMDLTEDGKIIGLC